LPEAVAERRTCGDRATLLVRAKRPDQELDRPAPVWRTQPNNRLQPTPSSLRYAPASGRG